MPQTLPHPSASEARPRPAQGKRTLNALNVRALAVLVKDSLLAWQRDRAASMGAALAYYTLFSIGPLLLIVITVAGMVFGVEAAQGEISAQMRDLVGDEGARAIEALLASVHRSDRSLLGTLLSGSLLLVGATSVLAELQSALDRIWHTVDDPPAVQTAGWKAVVRTRLLSFGLILGVGFLLTVSLVTSAALAAWSRWWAPAFAAWPWVLEGLNFLLSFTFTALLFAMIYRVMPSTTIAWQDVGVGAVVTALLFNVGKALIGLYLGTSGLASGIGAAGSVVVLLAWVYYSAQVFLVGAEFTWLYAYRFGSRAEQAGRPAA